MKTRVIKTASIAFLLTVATLSVNAQRPGGGMQQREKLSPEKIAEIKTDKLDQVLELTDKQESKIYDIILSCANSRPEKAERPDRPERDQRAERGADKEQNREAMAEQREQMQQQREQMQEQRLATTKAIMAVLNDDQKIEYAIYLSREGAPRQGQPQQGRGGDRREAKDGRDAKGGQRGQGGPQGQDAPRS